MGRTQDYVHVLKDDDGRPVTSQRDGMTVIHAIRPGTPTQAGRFQGYSLGPMEHVGNLVNSKTMVVFDDKTHVR